MIYKIDGREGKPWVIFSNSLGADMSMWDDQVEFLKDDFHLLRYQTIGVGRKSVAELGRDLLDLMKTLDIEQAHFCGISLGGLIGQWLAINLPESFLSFSLSNTAPCIGSKEVWEQRIELVKKEGLEPVRKASSARWFTQGFIERYPSQVEKALQGFLETTPEDYMSLCYILASTNLWEELGKITSPVLIFAGGSDEVTTVKEAQEMQKRIDLSELKILQASHLANLEDPCFNEYLYDFVMKNS